MQETDKPSLLRNWAEFVKFSHTIFALPFALAATVLAARASHYHLYHRLPKMEQKLHESLEMGWPGWKLFGLIVLAMITARTCAMAFNRIVDRKFDAQNPRTKKRHLPTGKISLTSAWVLCILSGILFVGSAYAIDLVRDTHDGRPICLIFSPVALLFILGYSLTKRFTDFTHVFLGIALGLAPLGAWLAINGDLSFSGPLKYNAVIPILLSISVILWLIGFDIIYAIQDFEFDRDHKLHSLVVRWGPDNALTLSLLVHFIMIAMLILFGLLASFRVAYWVGMVIIVACVMLEHWIARKRSLDWVQKAFFNLNGIISMVFLTMVVMEVSVVPRFISWRL
jgi:4-hydroxybenzoate polyprenyltransferase|tara:strand:- start:1229 stop:2245 length:1017 start_codon:yes stop_codon:yes gene_type:complete